MKLPQEKKAAILILLVVLLVFLLKGIEFIQTRQSVDLSLVQQQIQESFTDDAKKISECQCLPGHIPYKTKDGSIVCINIHDGKSTKSCY